MKRVKLEDICSSASSNISQKDIENVDGEYPIYGASGFIKNINFYKFDKESIAIVKDGAGIGKTFILPKKSSVIGTMQYIVPNENVDIRYLYYAIKALDLTKYRTGVTIPHIYFKDYKKEEILLPDLKKEQKRIVAILDKVQEVMDIKKNQIEELDEFIKSQFVEMFGNININDKKWKEDVLKNNLSVIGGYAFKSSGFQKSGIPILRIGNINTGKFRPKDLMFWKEDKSLANYEIYPNDVLISLTGTVGKEDYGNICIIGNDYPKYYLNQRNAKLNIKETLNREYISYALRVPEIKRRLTGISRGVRQANISNKDIENLKIPIPPIEIQNQFAEIVKQIDKHRFMIEKSLREIEKLQESLMNKYFGD